MDVLTSHDRRYQLYIYDISYLVCIYICVPYCCEIIVVNNMQVYHTLGVYY